MRFLVILGFVLALAGELIACTCSGQYKIDSAFVYTPVVFKGRVLNAMEDALFLNDNSGQFVLYTFEIIESMRGVNYKTEKITLFGRPFECCMCEFNFKVGEEYIVFAHYDGRGYLRTSSCTRTDRFQAFSKDDLTRLAYVVKRYNDEFDFTFQLWANEKLKDAPPMEMEEIRILKSTISSLSYRNSLYKYLSIVMCIWGVFCTGWLLYKGRILRKR